MLPTPITYCDRLGRMLLTPIHSNDGNAMARRNTVSLDGLLYRSTAYSIARRHTLLRSCFPRQVRPDGILYGGVVFSRQLSLDERNAGDYRFGFDGVLYCGVALFRQVRPDERKAGAFCYAFVLMIYGGGVISRQVNTR